MISFRSFTAVSLLAIVLFACKASKEGSFPQKYPEKYSLDIPEKWRKKPKLVEAITEIMPKVVKELNGRAFCIGCEAGYSVRLEMTEATLAGAGNGTEVYQFKAALAVYKDTVGIRRLLIVDPEIEDVVFHNGPQDTPPPAVNSAILPTVANFSNVKGAEGSEFRNYNVFVGGETRKTPKGQRVTNNDLLRYVETKIYEIKDILAEKE